MSKICDYPVGTIGFSYCKTNKLSRLIMWFMSLVSSKGDFKPSHTFLVIGKLYDKTLLLETTDFEVCLTTFEGKYDDNSKYEVRLFAPVKEYDFKASIDYALSLQGTMYGYFQLLTFALKILVKKVFRKDIKNLSQRGMVCTAVPLYFYLYSMPENPLIQFLPEQTMTGDLYDFVSGSELFKEMA